ncbi:MAG: MBL fold metallo-hydrolase, partial [Thermoleophilia bacterium]|nr:MBL fold metallo-hydrolase [Thermoleophilia bacterium]
DTYRGYNGYLIEAGRYRVLFAGDTAWTEALGRLRSNKPIDVAIMPVGAYNPWIRYHCTPEQAVRMANQAGAERIVPVHHRTFRLSNEPVDEPLERTLKAARPHPERVVIQEIGEEFHLLA